MWTIDNPTEKGDLSLEGEKGRDWQIVALL